MHSYSWGELFVLGLAAAAMGSLLMAWWEDRIALRRARQAAASWERSYNEVLAALREQQEAHRVHAP